MILYPAIDIKEGRCVRLSQGSFDAVKVYEENPARVAKAWEDAGASWIHTVDLDGALAGRAVNLDALSAIVRSVHIPVQTGGGIRSMEQIEEKLGVGIRRVIIGTAAVKNPDFLKEALSEYGAGAHFGRHRRPGWLCGHGGLGGSQPDARGGTGKTDVCDGAAVCGLYGYRAGWHAVRSECDSYPGISAGDGAGGDRFRGRVFDGRSGRALSRRHSGRHPG